MGLFGILRGKQARKGEDPKAAAPQPATQPATKQLEKVVDPHCPYCGFEFSPPPSKKKRCPSCSNYVYVRTRPKDPKDWKRYLVREDQLAEVEKEWEEYRKHQELEGVKQTFRESLQPTEKEYRRAEADLIKTGRFPRRVAEGDILWRIANERIVEAAQQDDWNTLVRLYERMAVYALATQGRASYLPIMQSARRCQLHQYEQFGVSVVEIGVHVQGCSKCRVLEGRRLTVSQALKEMPLPVEDCEHERCFCEYVPYAWQEVRK